MALGAIHYEVFVRRSKTGGWALHNVQSQRDAAIAEAKGILAENAAVGVRVFKETFKAETGDFLTLKVFEDGYVAEAKKKAGDTTSLPCFKPDDYYSFHGRRTIARLLRDALSRWQITATELLHHTGHIERLELTGTVLQGAVQKAAVRHAGATGENVQQIVKQLNELTSRAIQRVVLDERNGRLPRIGAEGFGALCLRYADTPGADYYLNAAIAWHIEDAKTWGTKLERVIALMAALPSDGPARTLGLKVIDSLVAEMLEGNAALGDLLGEQEDLGSALLKMADLFLGRLELAASDPPGVRALCTEFTRGTLVNAKAAIAQRVLTEIKGVRRLKPDSLDDELKVMRMLATRMVMGQGKLASQEEIMEAFTARSKHLVMPATIERYLEGLRRPEEKLDKLYMLEENVIGIANKRELVGYILAVLGQPKTESYFVESTESPVARLTLLTQFHKRNQRSSLQDLPKRQIAERIEAIAARVEQKAQLIEGLTRNAPGPFDAVERLLYVITSDVLPEGALSATVRERVRTLMKQPEFRAAAQSAEPPRREALTALLAKAGIEPGSAKTDAAA